MRPFPLLCLCVAAALRLTAAPPAPAAVEPASWPDHGPYRKVGRLDVGAGGLRVPRPVAAALGRIVPGDPAQWVVFDETPDFAGHGWHILKVEGDPTGYAALLIARGSWTILGAPASLPTLNEVLDPLSPADLRRYRKKANDYLWHVVLLQRHGRGGFLDRQFRHQNVDNSSYKLWTDGTRAQRRDLRSLCHEPVVTFHQERATVRLHVITTEGAVERWTYRLRLEGNAVRLEGTDVRQLRKAGTFFYPLV